MNETPESLRARLQRRARRLRTTRIVELYAREPDRLARLVLEAAGLHLDLSKQLLDRAACAGLLRLAQAAGVPAAISAMFAGETINRSERRAVLHTALRAGPGGTARVDGAPVAPQVAAVRARMAALVAAVRDGTWTGAGGRRITDVVNIGIGGSHLGPQLACDALRDAADGRLRVHFLANVDGNEFARVSAPLMPDTTLFIVASKSFTTSETRLNARAARAWLTAHCPDADAVARHFVAVSASPERAVEFGIAADNVYPMWDWVGGRYSLWSAIGLPVAFALGMDGFDSLLAGAHALDEHFRTAPPAANLPVMAALVQYWNVGVLGASTHAVVPYDDRLRYLPDFLQQLEMESNGKRVDVDDAPLRGHSADVTWGGLGTNAQHAFFQLLHQGTRLVPVEFIVALSHPTGRREHHDVLIANCFAQAEGLMLGHAPDGPHAAARTSPGNRPSSMLTVPSLTPATLGALLAYYEHRTFVLSVLWNINAFDQWGVELGKRLADVLQQEIASGAPDAAHDPSTQSLLLRYLAQRNAPTDT